MPNIGDGSKFTVTPQQLQSARDHLKNTPSQKMSELNKAEQVAKESLSPAQKDIPSPVHKVRDSSFLRESNEVNVINDKSQAFLANATKKAKKFVQQKIFKNSFSMSKLEKGFKSLMRGLNPHNIVKHFTSSRPEETSDKKTEAVSTKQYSELSKEEKIQIAKTLIPKAVQEIINQKGEKQEGVFRLSGRDGPQKAFLNKVASDPSILENELELEITDFEGIKSKVKPSVDDFAGLIKKTISQLTPQTISLSEETKALLTPEQLKSYEESKEESQIGEEEKAALKESLQPLYELFVEINRNQELTKLTWNTLSISAPEIINLMKQLGFEIPKDS